MTDLVTVKQSLYAANKEVIKVDGAGSAQDGISQYGHGDGLH